MVKRIHPLSHHVIPGSIFLTPLCFCFVSAFPSTLLQIDQTPIDGHSIVKVLLFLTASSKAQPWFNMGPGNPQRDTKVLSPGFRLIRYGAKSGTTKYLPLCGIQAQFRVIKYYCAIIHIFLKSHFINWKRMVKDHFGLIPDHFLTISYFPTIS